MQMSLIDRNKDTERAYRLSISFFQTIFLQVLPAKYIRLIIIIKYPLYVFFFQALFQTLALALSMAMG
jgi:hypothetical protein